MSNRLSHAREVNPYIKGPPSNYPDIKDKELFDISDIKNYFNIIISGDVSKLDIFLTNQNDLINILDSNTGENALHKIINTSLPLLTKLDVIKFLIGKGIHIDAKDQMGETALSIVCKNSEKEIALELINAGADINTSNKFSISPLHYLAKGTIIDCEPTEPEDIIDQPKPKHDKKAISKIGKDIKDFYNNELLQRFCSDLNKISQINPLPAALVPYPDRLIKYFEHIGSAVTQHLDNNKDFPKLEAELGNNINRIVKDVTISDDEKKLNLEILKTEFYDKAYKILKSSDAMIEEPIDLTSTTHIDDDGLYLANLDGEYASHPAAFNAIISENTYFKVHSGATFNQNLIKKKEENINHIKDLIVKLTNNMIDIDKQIGDGVFETTNRIINLTYGLTQLKEIWRLREFIDTPNPPNNVPRYNQNMITKDKFTIRKVNLSAAGFNDRFFLRYADAANELNVQTQENKNARNTFNNTALNGIKVDILPEYTVNSEFTFNLHADKMWRFTDKTNSKSYYLSNLMNKENMAFVQLDHAPVPAVPPVPAVNEMERLLKINEAVRGTRLIVKSGIERIATLLDHVQSNTNTPPQIGYAKARSALATGIQDYYDTAKEWWKISAEIEVEDRKLIREIDAQFGRALYPNHIGNKPNSIIWMEVNAWTTANMSQFMMDNAPGMKGLISKRDNLMTKLNEQFTKIYDTTAPGAEAAAVEGTINRGIATNNAAAVGAGAARGNLVAGAVPLPPNMGDGAPAVSIYPINYGIENIVEIPTADAAGAGYILLGPDPLKIYLTHPYGLIIPRASGSLVTAARGPGQARGVVNNFYEIQDVKIKNIADHYLRSAQNYAGLYAPSKNDTEKPLHKLQYGWRHYQELLVFLPEVIFGGKAPTGSRETLWGTGPLHAVDESKQNESDLGKLYDVRGLINAGINRGPDDAAPLNNINDFIDRDVWSNYFIAGYENAPPDGAASTYPISGLVENAVNLTPLNNAAADANSNKYTTTVNVRNRNILSFDELPRDFFLKKMTEIKEAWNVVFGISKDGMSISPPVDIRSVDNLTDIMMSSIEPMLFEHFGITSIKQKINNSQLKCSFLDEGQVQLDFNFQGSIPLPKSMYDITYWNIGAVGAEQILGYPINETIAAAGAVQAEFKFDITPLDKPKDLSGHFNDANIKYIMLPLIALSNDIKNKNILSVLTDNIKSIFNDKILTNEPLKIVRIRTFVNMFHKCYLRYYHTLDKYYDEIQIQFNENLTDITSKELKLVGPAGGQDKILSNKSTTFQEQIHNTALTYISNTELNFGFLDERSSLKSSINDAIVNINNLLDEANKNVYLDNMYQYWNTNNPQLRISRTLARPINPIKLDDSKLTIDSGNAIGAANRNNYFNYYVKNEFIEYVLNNGNKITMNKVGIRYEVVAGAGVLEDFSVVKYDPSSLQSYYYYSRYRIIEELVLYFYNQRNVDLAPGAPPAAPMPTPYKKIYNQVDRYVQSQMGDLAPQNRVPNVLSIIGDLIDTNLISNIKKVVKDTVTQKINTKIRGADADQFIIQRNIVPRGETKIDYSAVDFEVDFGLNLGKLDDLVATVVTKLARLQSSVIMQLSYGDILLHKMEKRKNQIFYTNDFLSSIITEEKCIKIDNDLLIEIMKKNPQLNNKDHYGNTPIYYAVNSQNVPFVNELLKKNTKTLNIQNKNKKNVFQFILDKLDVLCNYFTKDKNIIYEMSNYYSIGLKEEIIKIGTHKNLVQNYDKLVLLYLFLLNSNFFNSLYAKDFRLNQILNDLSTNFEVDIPNGTPLRQTVEGYELFGTSVQANVQFNFKDIYKNPLTKYKNDNPTTIKKANVFNNLKEKLEEDRDKLQQKNRNLQTSIANATGIAELVDVTALININTNTGIMLNEIEENQTSIANLDGDIVKIRNAFQNRIDTNLHTNPDLFKQIIEISKVFRNDDVNKLSTGPFLKILEEISKDPKYYNNTFFFHHLISQAICKFVKNSQDIFDLTKNNIIYKASLIPHQETLRRLVTLMGDTMAKKIMVKNENKKDITKNKEINDEFMRLCFTVDIVVGNTFMKVLKKLLMTFLKTRYPPKNEKEIIYIKFIKEKVDLMLQKVEKYIQPDYRHNQDYNPSQLTKTLVSIYGNYKLGDDEFGNDDELELFSYIKDSIRNNGFEEIGKNEPIIKHLDRNFIPYFKDYYRVCITKLLNVIKSYENYIMNQYVNLDMFQTLLNKLLDFNETDLSQINKIKRL
jgi:ankyrin repeat protein